MKHELEIFEGMEEVSTMTTEDYDLILNTIKHIFEKTDIEIKIKLSYEVGE